MIVVFRKFYAAMEENAFLVLNRVGYLNSITVFEYFHLKLCIFTAIDPIYSKLRLRNRAKISLSFATTEIRNSLTPHEQELRNYDLLSVLTRFLLFLITSPLAKIHEFTI